MRSIRIPSDRVGALVGKDGSSKKMIEERTGIKLQIDKEGEVVYDDNAEGVEPIMALQIMDVIKAVGRGFNPDKAMKLLDDDDMYFESIDIKDVIGDRQNQVVRARGRLIGKDGKTRKLIEDLADVYMSVYGNTVSLIGNSISLPIAKNAIEMLLHGSEHSTVYHYLESQRPKLRIAEMGFDL
ncbi:MAG: RNA-processing protein [Candidatus Methanomethylophilus sp.]|jgi:ribosomal RNA assembly protein|nr:RNA-binding protein [methanogenic archaeon ISO4-H5]MBO5519197.1 RNA-processing protein [Methanomethylophilus sp.]MBO5600206.1 RNA-processing protein [Methanomethylophilus sp.]MBR1888845.1 RNA-processing protein [Methanomethylophilus sp.]MEE3363190.1 KH domain-containing protein [Methanomethylophilus sp.]